MQAKNNVCMHACMRVRKCIRWKAHLVSTQWTCRVRINSRLSCRIRVDYYFHRVGFDHRDSSLVGQTVANHQIAYHARKLGKTANLNEMCSIRPINQSINQSKIYASAFQTSDFNNCNGYTVIHHPTNFLFLEWCLLLYLCTYIQGVR